MLAEFRRTRRSKAPNKTKPGSRTTNPGSLQHVERKRLERGLRRSEGIGDIRRCVACNQYLRLLCQRTHNLYAPCTILARQKRPRTAPVCIRFVLE